MTDPEMTEQAPVPPHGEARTRATALGCAALVDAMGRQYPHRAHLPAFESPAPSRVLFGPAVTMQFLPTRSDLPGSNREFGDVFTEAVADAPDGAVLVMSSGGYPHLSHAGGVKLVRVARHGLSGVLADGQLRDFGELADLGFATWCRGEAVRWGGDSVMPAAGKVAVEIAGVTVVPGDFIYVDAAGGVVIPQAGLQAVLDEAEQIAADDALSRRRIAAGDQD